MVAACSQCWVAATIAVCTAWPVLPRYIKKRSAIIWSIKAAGGVREAIVQEQKGSHESDSGIIIYCDLLLDIGHDLLMVHKGIVGIFTFTAQSMELTGLMFWLFGAVVQTT